MEDIEPIILQHLSLDDLLNYCSQDKTKLKKCLSRQFWVSHFNQYQMILPNQDFKSLDEVKDTFDKLKALQLTNQLVQRIENQDFIVLNTQGKFKKYLQLLKDAGFNVDYWNEDYPFLTDQNEIVHVEIDGELEEIYCVLIYKGKSFAIPFSYTKTKLENFLYNGIYNNMLTINRV